MGIFNLGSRQDRFSPSTQALFDAFVSPQNVDVIAQRMGSVSTRISTLSRSTLVDVMYDVFYRLIDTTDELTVSALNREVLLTLEQEKMRSEQLKKMRKNVGYDRFRVPKSLLSRYSWES